ncbi:hypothetical protein EXIGLDRAFT_724905 [Exidia glandulosa HHB12029]|uniref:Pali-domain-containing protein n=1 Tax=Exidia glandulosa HHB12029 TaxID=1314781 RepID=A0A165E899_EXIGL|nr:hypothetical protein EXIGLDRAFT_724905 [Exidia glandulosa HHB12029]
MLNFDRSTCVPGTIFLIVAFAAGFLASISLPFLSALEVVRVNLFSVGQIRLGIWTGCTYDPHDNKHCLPTGHGYEFIGLDGFVSASWTRGLAITPVATGVTAIALVLALIPGGKYGLFASGTSFLAAFLMLLAFACDIALLAKTKNVYDAPGISTSAGAGFWLTFVSFIFLCVAGCTVCIGHRRSNGESIELGGVFKRFRR